MIAFLGMGLLGSNFVRAFRRRGEDVRVWNRTPDRARALTADGATVCESAADAARGARRIHLTLSDDAAVDEVLENARPGIDRDAVIIDHTTTSPPATAERARRWLGRGIAFLHAPVFMGPQNALESTGVMLASGDRDRFERLEPALAPMTGKLVYLGPDPDRAAAFKLLGNSFLMFLTAGFGDFFSLAKSFGIPAKEAATLFKFFNPGVTIPARLERVLNAKWSDPSWELSMARKDARLMLEGAQHAGNTLAVLPAIAKLMDQYIERGHGRDDWTVIAKDALSSSSSSSSSSKS